MKNKLTFLKGGTLRHNAPSFVPGKTLRHKASSFVPSGTNNNIQQPIMSNNYPKKKKN